MDTGARQAVVVSQTMVLSPEGEAPQFDARRVERAIEALSDDHARQDGHLERDQVVRTIEKRGLTPTEAAEVWSRIPSPDTAKVVTGWKPARGATRLAGKRDATSRAAPDPVKMYLKEIGKISLLDADDEVVLGRRIRAGEAARMSLQSPDVEPVQRTELRRLVAEGDDARLQLTTSNLRLVVNIAKRYASQSQLDLLDVIQEGNLGLMRAVEKFDHTKGFKFSTYATWWIRQGITRAIADKGRTVRLPVHVVERLAKVRRARERLFVELEHEPTLAELAEASGETTAATQFLLDVQSEPMSLDLPVGDDDDGCFGDFLPDPYVVEPDILVERKLLVEAVEELLAELSEREQQVMRLRFGLDGSGERRTLEAVGVAFGVTRERIRQIESKTLAKLRHPMRLNKVIALLDFDPRERKSDETNGAEDAPPNDE